MINDGYIIVLFMPRDQEETSRKALIILFIFSMFTRGTGSGFLIQTQLLHAVARFSCLELPLINKRFRMMAVLFWPNLMIICDFGTEVVELHVDGILVALDGRQR